MFRKSVQRDINLENYADCVSTPPLPLDFRTDSLNMHRTNCLESYVSGLLGDGTDHLHGRTGIQTSTPNGGRPYFPDFVADGPDIWTDSPHIRTDSTGGSSDCLNNQADSRESRLNCMNFPSNCVRITEHTFEISVQTVRTVTPSVCTEC